MDPIIILIFVATVAVCIGFLLGFMVRSLTSQKTDSSKASEPKQPASTRKAPKRGWIEVANLWRDSRDGRLIFQIEDQHYKRGDELTIREREILLKVVMDFYRWLEPPSTIPPRSKESETPGTVIDNRQSEFLSQVIPPSGKLQEEPTRSSTEVRPPVGIIGSVLSATMTMPESPAQSMVAQVNDILQGKLHAAGMQKWAVRLTESPNKGMVVWVGMERYEAIDEVPYKRVRDMIRVSVVEWEQRAEAGDTDQ